jgi:hypothetical protein
MKLSQAIRLGSMLHPQTYKRYSKYDVHGAVMATCALGAAIEAGYDIHAVSFAAVVPCPHCRFDCPSRNACVIHLNDVHHWSRDHIADWSGNRD